MGASIPILAIRLKLSFSSIYSNFLTLQHCLIFSYFLFLMAQSQTGELFAMFGEIFDDEPVQCGKKLNPVFFFKSLLH
jgi:hypothetical protein